jgi:hypothetical protein
LRGDQNSKLKYETKEDKFGQHLNDATWMFMFMQCQHSENLWEETLDTILLLIVFVFPHDHHRISKNKSSPDLWGWHWVKWKIWIPNRRIVGGSERVRLE